MPAQTVIKLRRDTTANWESVDPTLAAGEIAFDTTAMKFKVGDGTSAWTDLDYSSDPESVVAGLEDYADAAASAAQSAAEDYADGLASNYDAAGTASSAVTAHNEDTTSVHGIADTTLLFTTAGGTLTGYLTLHADPTQALHAATKEYVDNTASGIVAKPQVLGATTANIDATYDNGTAGVGATLTHNTNGVFPSTAGGATGWQLGSGILVKNQTNKAENGRYYISDMGSASTPYVLTRCGYCDTADEIPGAYIFVQAGTNAGTGWIQVVADPTTFVVGTDDINVFQFSGAGTYTAGNGLTLTGTQFAIDTAVTATQSDLTSKQNVVSGVSDTEIGYLDGVTSSIQSQINSKASIDSPTFTGTVSGVTKAHVGLDNVDNTSDANKPVSTATQTALNLKANLASPTFTGNVSFTGATVTGIDALPSQSGNSGRYLTTNGTVASWAAIDVATKENLIINGAFEINQRSYVSGANLASGAYGFDRWKSSFTNTTLTYTSTPQGQLVTINSGGSIKQIVERQNVIAGTYTLSWQGTATGRVYNSGSTAPSYAASPITVNLNGLQNIEVEFTASGGTRTLGFVKLEPGSVATTFRRNGASIESELAACQRYYIRFVGNTYGGFGPMTYDGMDWAAIINFSLPVHMRTKPASIDRSGGTLVNLVNSSELSVSYAFLSLTGNSSLTVYVAAAGSGTSGALYSLYFSGATSFMGFSAEL
jgi:hypothetical protein